MHHAGLITVRTTSSRLPKKCLLKFGSRTVLEHNILRAQHFGIRPIVCTTQHQSDDIVEEISKNLGVDCFRGPTENKMLRWLLCAKNYKLTNFHTLDCDDPFIDYSLVHKSLTTLISGNYDFIKPSERSASGAASVGYSMSTTFLSDAIKDIAIETNTEMVDAVLARIPSALSMQIQESQNPVSPVRLTLDYLEDWVLVHYLESIFGFNSSRMEIDLYFQENPDLYKVNWFRNLQWQQRQDEITENIRKEI